VSANGQQPPVAPPQGAPGAAIAQNEQLRELLALLHTPAPAPGQQPGQELEAQAQALDVEAIIKQLPEQPPPQYGELPGLGYLYPDAPEKRQATLVKTTPEFARDTLLRAIEVCGFGAMFPFSETKPGEWAKAALAYAQAYLLLDPSVDNQGVPVGAAAMAQGDAQATAAHAQGAAQQAVNGHKAGLDEAAAEHGAILGGHVAAHQSGQAWSFPVTKAGVPEPPKVLPNPAEKAIETKGALKTEELKGARGDLPRPKPRVGS
jgi:hypothetical protein